MSGTLPDYRPDNEEEAVNRPSLRRYWSQHVAPWQQPAEPKPKPEETE